MKPSKLYEALHALIGERVPLGCRNHRREETAGDVWGLPVVRYLGDGTRSGGRSSPLDTNGIADRAVLGLRTSDHRHARLCLSLGEPGMAQPARSRTPTPRSLAPAHPTQSCLRHSMEMAARAYRSSVAEPGRRPRLSDCEEPCRSSEHRCVTACRRPLCDTRQIV